VIPAARVSAAIEVLAEIETRKRPAVEVLKDWGIAHRFAGSKDRAFIADLVYDALRVRASSAYAMAQETPRALVLGALGDVRGLDLDAVDALFTGAGYAPEPLSEGERARFVAWDLVGAPPYVRGNFPNWLADSFAVAFGDDAVAEGQALAHRAALDLRVNILKGNRRKAFKALAHLNPEATPYSPFGLRIRPSLDGRGPAMQAEPAYVKGLVEIQDEGSQLAAQLSAARAGEQVLDLCAGAGGKTLAMASLMANKGQIYAYDADGRRLTPALARLTRSAARNVQVRAPRGTQDVLADLVGHCDLVFVDAPCTGSGTWRRNPDAKWRTRPGALEQRIVQQKAVLEQAATYTKPGGRVAYVTCSVLCEENEARVRDFLTDHADFSAEDAMTSAAQANLPELARFASPHSFGLRLSPRTADTDGFFVAVLRRH
jgi:16S rRNA (cytosine967-C5)-methyltransferase